MRRSRKTTSLTIAEDSVDAVIDVLANDVNVDGASDPLRVAACYVGRRDNPHGSFRVAADGSHVIYTPEANFFGTATFSCIIGDNHHSGANAPTSRVTVTVTPVNDPPTAVDDVDHHRRGQRVSLRARARERHVCARPG